LNAQIVFPDLVVNGEIARNIREAVIAKLRASKLKGMLLKLHADNTLQTVYLKAGDTAEVPLSWSVVGGGGSWSVVGGGPPRELHAGLLPMNMAMISCDGVATVDKPTQHLWVLMSSSSLNRPFRPLEVSLFTNNQRFNSIKFK
jgi:hypothetical protein